VGSAHRDVAPKDYESLQMTRTARQPVDAFQTRSNSNPLRSAVAEVGDHLGDLGPVHSDGQIAQLGEVGPLDLVAVN